MPIIANISDGLLDLVNHFSPEELILIGALIMTVEIRILIYANNETKKQIELINNILA